MNVPAKPAACLVDDDSVLRNAFRVLMKSSGIPGVVYASAEEFLATFDRKNIGCILLDVRMPGMGGLELLDTLRKRQVFIPALIVTAYADVPLAVRAMRLGALDVIEKPYRDENLLSQVRKALVINEKLEHFQAERQLIAPRLASLTQRELEVLDLMVKGRKNKVIAEELGISPKTLDIHRGNIMRKMKTKTVADLVRWRLLSQADPFGIIPLAVSLAG